MRLSLLPALALLLIAIAPAPAAQPPAPYLDAASEPDATLLLPPPPPPDSPIAAEERRIFSTTRSLEGTSRWALATADADRDPRTVLTDFSCALGTTLVPARLPRLVGLLGRLNADVESATAAVKAHYARARPLVGNTAPLCVPRSPKLDASFSYPSGHATQGWATALILAELAPDRAAALLARGRVYGESRIVCGAHWPSDVEAARLAAAALIAVLHDAPIFRADLEAARQDLAGFRQAGAAAPEAAACRAEADAAAHPPQDLEPR